MFDYLLMKITLFWLYITGEIDWDIFYHVYFSVVLLEVEEKEKNWRFIK